MEECVMGYFSNMSHLCFWY